MIAACLSVGLSRLLSIVHVCYVQWLFLQKRTKRVKFRSEQEKRVSKVVIQPHPPEHTSTSTSIHPSRLHHTRPPSLTALHWYYYKSHSPDSPHSTRNSTAS
jgi:hypothetical protein